MEKELKVFSAVAGAASAIPGSVALAAITAPAPGIAGWLGFTATTTVTVPISAPVVIGAGLCVGGYMAYKRLKESD